MESRHRQILELKSRSIAKPMNSLDFALSMDEDDELKTFKDKFYFPNTLRDSIGDGTKEEGEIIFLCSHSLGLKPKKSDEYVHRVMKSWEERAINCQYEGFLDGVQCDVYPREMMANMIGAKTTETLIMNALTVNLHLMMAAFYKPTADRFKIIMEHNAFPSDNYAVKSVLKMHGYSEERALITLKPRKGQYCLEYDDILSTIKREGHSVALIMLPGVQFFTGQVLNMKDIVELGHKMGCKVGLDLAHAVGNTELHLHDWGVDFAVWCTYKYLSSGPGGIGGAFVHERNSFDHTAPSHLQGWWGNRQQTKFDMNEGSL